LQRKQIKIDLIIDLHGMNLDEAFAMLKNNLSKSNNKKILVITGKSGVMHDLVPRWATYNKDVFYKIREIKKAPNHMGGDGAFIIYLNN